MTIQSDNKVIARNTIFMYLRMGVTMIVGLYTSRVVLQQLGVEDYGLYNVIGSIVAMFSFINASMVNATSRFITFYLAKSDLKMLNTIFSMSFIIHLIIGLIIILLGETIGLWYLNNKLVIPDGRIFAAQWIYQLSIVSSFIGILYVPYNATIVAHEKMKAFAYISILDTLLKLIIVLLISISPIDKLIVYGTLLTCVSILDISIYYFYCKRNFIETKLKYYWNKSIFKDMMGFAGWTLTGSFSYLFYSQGINLMLNAFCGPTVNAARGIAVQVESVVKQFASNVQVAINPQIIKSFATNELDRMYSLIFTSSRFCFYLLYFISLPILIETDFILHLWLGQVPAHTVNFIRIILCISLLDAFINPMFTANLATGKLKLYNLSVCSVSYVFMIITYCSIRFSHIPESVFFCLFISTLIGVAIRTIVLYKQIGLSPVSYLSKVIFRVIIVVLASLFLPIYIHIELDYGWYRFLVTSIVSICSIILSVIFLGISNSERTMVNLVVQKILKR